MPKNVTVQDAATTCACHKVRIAARAVTRAYDEALRPVALRSTQFSVLVAASVAAGIPLNQLATTLSMERTTLTRSLDAIEKEGLIRVESVDGRTRKVVLTQRGKDRLDLAIPLWNQAQQKLRRRLGEQRWAIVNEGLVMLAEAAKGGSPNLPIRAAAR
jgi:DNA-binding MarR family transcriptional regulator